MRDVDRTHARLVNFNQTTSEIKSEFLNFKPIVGMDTGWFKNYKQSGMISETIHFWSCF